MTTVYGIDVEEWGSTLRQGQVRKVMWGECSSVQVSRHLISGDVYMAGNQAGYRLLLQKGKIAIL